MQVHGGVDLRLVSKPMSVHRRIPSDEALMRMAAHHRAPVPKLPTVTSPPTSPTPSQDLTSIVDAMHEGTSWLCYPWEDCVSLALSLVPRKLLMLGVHWVR